MSNKIGIVCLHCGEIRKVNSPKGVRCIICKGKRFHTFDEIADFQNPIEYAASIRRDYVDLGLQRS